MSDKESSIKVKDKKKKVVSYSQYSKWYKCPQSWKLDYVDGLREYEHNLILSFGNAIHKVIQDYVKILYTEGMIKATTFDVKGEFINHYVDEIKEHNIKHTDEELKEFMMDGYNLLTEFMTAAIRLKHFPPNEYEFLGVEDDLIMPIANNVDYWGFIDLVLKNKNTGKIKIFDFKTARQGWNSYQKEDLAKISQVLLYKALYSKKHNVPISQIDVEFFILKRKLYENTKYSQSHIQIFRPDASQSEVTRVVKHFNEFVNECFNSDGSYNTNAFYPKIPGKNKKNCTYCLHKGTNCDAIPDKLD